MVFSFGGVMVFDQDFLRGMMKRVEINLGS